MTISISSPSDENNHHRRQLWKSGQDITKTLTLNIVADYSQIYSLFKGTEVAVWSMCGFYLQQACLNDEILGHFFLEAPNLPTLSIVLYLEDLES